MYLYTRCSCLSILHSYHSHYIHLYMTPHNLYRYLNIPDNLRMISDMLLSMTPLPHLLCVHISSSTACTTAPAAALAAAVALTAAAIAASDAGPQTKPCTGSSAGRSRTFYCLCLETVHITFQTVYLIRRYDAAFNHRRYVINVLHAVKYIHSFLPVLK